MKKLQLTIDLEHASQLMIALEAISRFGMVQLDVALDMFNNHHYKKLGRECFSRDIISWFEKNVKEVLTESGVDVHHDSIKPKETVVAWDAYQYVRRELSWNHDGLDWRTATPEQKTERCWRGVMYDNPINTSGATFDCKIVEE